MNPLSVGNVVSAGLRIYRDNFKKYFKLAFFGYLWIFVPVYGWAKYSAMMGLISRLAFREVAEQPEAVKDAQRHIKPKMWDLFAAGLLVSLIFVGAVIPYFVIFGIFAGIIGAILGQSTTATGIIILLTVTAILLFIFGFIWLISRLFLVELPLAVEENANPVSAISRSWQLTKGSVGRIQLVVFLAILISAPIAILINVVSVILQFAIGAGLENTPGLAALGSLLYLAVIIAGGALMIPFWQAIKAVVYYDLRVRREGMGIDLRK
jgi:membrane-anchored glycerophosphoryl diester phosphodiesterase (GDPDase)